MVWDYLDYKFRNIGQRKGGLNPKINDHIGIISLVVVWKHILLVNCFL